MDFEYTGNNVLIMFPFAENDQFHKGNSLCLVSNGTDLDPVKIVREYFRLCGLENGDTSRPNCIMRRRKGGLKLDGTQGVSYTTGTNNWRAMMAKMGRAYMWPDCRTSWQRVWRSRRPCGTA